MLNCLVKYHYMMLLSMNGFQDLEHVFVQKENISNGPCKRIQI